jgi:hypothetical protein
MNNRIKKVADVINKNRGRELVLGEWDCCIFGADVILAVTGEDKMENFRGKYSSVKDYKKILRKMKVRSLLGAVTKVLGEPMQNKAKAWRGDIVFHNGNIGVCYGPTAYFIGEEDYVEIPMSEIKFVFGVR